MKLSFPHMFSRFNGLPHLSRRLAQPLETPGPQHQPQSAAESPGFLHSGFVPFEPDLTQELGRALGAQAARYAGERP
jgi:hypothetical protein